MHSSHVSRVLHAPFRESSAQSVEALLHTDPSIEMDFDDVTEIPGIVGLSYMDSPPSTPPPSNLDQGEDSDTENEDDMKLSDGGASQTV